MKRQRNTTSMKEQTRNTEVQINEGEIGKLTEKEFRIIIVKIFKTLENRMEKIQELINKDLEELKNKHTNNTITKIKNILEGTSSRKSEAEERISELEDKMVEITSEEQNKVKEAQRVPYKINPRRNMPRHILIKLTKTKHKVLKAAREKP